MNPRVEKFGGTGIHITSVHHITNSHLRITQKLGIEHSCMCGSRDVLTKAFPSSENVGLQHSQRVQIVFQERKGRYIFLPLLTGTHHFASQQYLVLADYKSVAGLTKSSIGEQTENCIVQHRFIHFHLLRQR